MAENRREPAVGDIKGVLFDKDGTLFDFHGTWGPILSEVAEELAQKDSHIASRMLAAIGYREETGRFAAGSIAAAGDTFELADAWLGLLGLDNRAALIARLDDFFAKLGPERSIPVTDLGVFFRGMKARGLKLGIATNDVAASAEGTILRFGLSDHLDFAAGYDSGHGVKPGPGMALAFCATTGLKPVEIAVVGDNRHDLEMGSSAGAGLLIGVLTGASAEADLSPLADRVIADITLLPGLLDQE
ncbi:HAD family hydrolase [Parvibaculum sp.]|uniref:HAD family hydrolase n=1 Tax=Parvibaculum sp. TaxID=2024848 RepID=UPI001B09C2FC|nr:HAD family hydrolase [Parvibaculum sp.]MBO6669569.1 HAD family hydrolase [Parvibaculum sp.]MBO6691976.1 HAD family hydrolase [Parvibaculum sp.]